MNSKVFGHLLLFSNQFGLKGHNARFTGNNSETTWNNKAAVRSLFRFGIVSHEYRVSRSGIASIGQWVTINDVVAEKAVVKIRKRLLPVCVTATVLDLRVHSYG